MTEQICVRCILPESFPGISFDDDGVCNHCQRAPGVEELKRQRKEAETAIHDLLEIHRNNPSGYDVIVAYSGGKDSTFLLWMLTRQMKMNCLAITIDNGFLSEDSHRNCRQLADKLETDHIFFRPAGSFMRKMYSESYKGGIHLRSSLMRASEICNSCIRMINTHMIKSALLNDVSIIAGGYIGGQVPNDGSILELNIGALAKAGEHTQKKFVERFGDRANHYFGLDQFTDQQTRSGPIYVINPLLSIDYSEEKILETLRELGWRRPNDTGAHSTNCRINDLGIRAHLENYGFHPYVLELAEQVRNGFKPRDEALHKIQQKPSADALKDIMVTLDIKPDVTG